MGLFSLIPARRRAWLITLGNAVMIASGGIRCAAVYAVCTAAAYIAGLAIDSMHTDSSKKILRTVIAAAMYILSIAALCLCSPRGAEISLFLPLRSAIMAVLPLHMISYTADVYRGDCKAQKDPLLLAAYLGFFPSAGYGPVFRYKAVRSSFEKPETDIGRLSEGVRFYIMGLAAYVVIAVRLGELHRELLGTPASQFSGYTAVMGIFVYYAWFGTSVIGSVLMGHGLSVMQGIRTGHSFKRRFMQPGVYQRLREFNIPLCRWLKDYVTLPLRRAGLQSWEAQSLAVMIGAVWYDLSTGWLAASVLLVFAIALQSLFTAKHKRSEITYLLGSMGAKLVTLAAVSCAALWELVNGKAGFAIFRSGSADDEFFYSFFSEAVIPVTLGLIITGSVLHSLIKRMNLQWFNLVLPLVELVFLAIATAYMVR